MNFAYKQRRLNMARPTLFDEDDDQLQPPQIYINSAFAQRLQVTPPPPQHTPPARGTTATQ